MRVDFSELRHELYRERYREFASCRQEMEAMELRLSSKIDDKLAGLLKWQFLFWLGTMAVVLLGRREGQLRCKRGKLNPASLLWCRAN